MATKMPEGSVNVGGVKLEPISGGIAKMLGFGGGGKKRVYPEIKFNPDGTVIPAKNINQNKAYRKAGNLATQFQAFLPSLTAAQNKANIDTSRSSAENQLNLLQSLGSKFADTNVSLDRIGQLGQLETNKLVDPEFFKLREMIGDKGLSLLGGQDPNSLSEAEIANAERLMNRNNIGNGTANTGSNLAGIKNALTFDDRLQSKRSSLSNTLSSIASFAPNLRGGATINGPSGAGGAQAQVGGSFNGGNSASGQIGQTFLAGRQGNQDLSQQLSANKVSNWEKVAGAVPDY